MTNMIGLTVAIQILANVGARRERCCQYVEGGGVACSSAGHVRKTFSFSLPKKCLLNMSTSDCLHKARMRTCPTTICFRCILIASSTPQASLVANHERIRLMRASKRFEVSTTRESYENLQLKRQTAWTWDFGPSDDLSGVKIV